MTPDKNREIARDDMAFKLYVVENLGGIKADVDHLKTQNADQFSRIQKLEAGPRTAMIGSGAIATVLIGIVEAIRRVAGCS